MKMSRLIVGVVWLVWLLGSYESEAAPAIHRILPPLEVPALQENVEGYTIVNFWASWCVPCVKELPIFEDLNKKYHNWNIKFVNIDSDKATADAFLRRHQLLFVADNMLHDPLLSIMRKLKMRGIPSTVAVDKDRGIYGIAEGDLTPDELAFALREFERYLLD